MIRSGALTFRQISRSGFGDRHNSWAWSMCWWKGKLYVGTNRAWHCAERAGINSAFPLFVKYPPDDPDAECTPKPQDLPLQAEIWCWTPETDQWERLYQSPQEVPIPGQANSYVAHEVGFRDMAVFIEPDGTEAMYVSGVNARFIFRPVPPPRLLRSVDGLTFEPIPQEPGTFMGELDKCTLRTITVYKNRLFVIAGSIRGDGLVLESSNPAAGNDYFRQVSPDGVNVFEMLPFNGYLYLGLRDPKRGYVVVKTEATGSPPYTFIPVVTEGAFLPKPSLSVISMQVYQGRLYVGTDRPGEVIRINPDDSWDLVIGTPRQTPDGWKYPISGLDAGFGNWLNGHIWRMQVFNERLYIGTWNMATEFRTIAGAAEVLKPNYGFDLFETADGWHYTSITTTGFDDKFNYGLRSFASTPEGLFVGTANKWYGLQVWQGIPEEKMRSSPLSSCGPPERLEVEDALLGVEQTQRGVMLSWECPATVKSKMPSRVQFRIWRAPVTDERHKVEKNPFLTRILRIARAILALMPDLYIPPLPEKLWVPGAYAEIGVTEQCYFEDTTAVPDRRYLYYVQADIPDTPPERSTGGTRGSRGVWEYGRAQEAHKSNVVAGPPLTPPVTFESLLKRLDELAIADKTAAKKIAPIFEKVREAQTQVKANDLRKADQLLSELMQEMETHLAGEPLMAADLQILLLKLRRRVVLGEAGLMALKW